jgi:3-methyladenine DNA glycosylase/8-oxoguanine DNA glycosylase
MPDAATAWHRRRPVQRRDPATDLSAGAASPVGAAAGAPAGAVAGAPVSAPEPASVARSDDGGLRLDWLAPFDLNVLLTLAVHRRGRGDPTFRVDADGAIWRTSLTPNGPATIRLTARRPDDGAAAGGPGNSPGGSGSSPGKPGRSSDDPGSAAGLLVNAQAWGDGATWLIGRVPGLLGAADDPAAFRPDHPWLRRLVQELPGLRISQTSRVFEALVPAVLEQKVVGVEARRAWRSLLYQFGLPAPGPAPAGLRVFPPPATWQAIGSWDWHRAGVEAVRARTIASAARVADRLEEICSLPSAQADRLLQSLPGIGVWTSAEIRQRAAGDPDAVSVGDYHIPGQVGWVLAGRPVDDAGMLDLLAPYAGQRYRVTRLIELSRAGPPRRGPRMPARDYRAI